MIGSTEGQGRDESLSTPPAGRRFHDALARDSGAGVDSA
jgi:hypothetical protein